MRLAEKLGWHFLDSGALYRLVAVAAMDLGIGADDEVALGRVADGLDVNFGISDDGMVILLDGNYITGRLRSEGVSVFASKIAAVPLVGIAAHGFWAGQCPGHYQRRGDRSSRTIVWAGSH